jgi:enoyl-CoA hydratase/carnithine racemase
LREEAIAYARTMTDKPRATLATLKRIMREGHGLSTAEGAALELKEFANYNRTQPYGREGYTAFREKRVPSWKAA